MNDVGRWSGRKAYLCVWTCVAQKVFVINDWNAKRRRKMFMETKKTENHIIIIIIAAASSMDTLKLFFWTSKHKSIENDAKTFQVVSRNILIVLELEGNLLKIFSSFSSLRLEWFENRFWRNTLWEIQLSSLFHTLADVLISGSNWIFQFFCTRLLEFA